MRNLVIGLVGLCLLLAPFVRPATVTPSLILDPATGPCDARPLARGTGFPSGLPVLLQRGGDNGPIVGRGTVAADGTLAVALDTLCDPAAPPADGTVVPVVATPGPGAQAGTLPLRAAAIYTIQSARDRPYFSETGFAIEGRFLAYWRAHGLDMGDSDITERESLALFGYPISGEFTQRLEDGKVYMVQYFERARFEWHPEQADPAYQVLLGQFGRQILGPNGGPTAP